jgi:hypothetical protein
MRAESPVKKSNDSAVNALLDEGFPLEAWQVENASFMGAKLTRESIDGGRLSFNQLVAFHPVDATTSILGATNWILGLSKWVNVTLTGHLRIGVQYLPGAVEAIRIAVADNEGTDKYLPALLLHEVPTLKTPPSLILEYGCFQPDRLARIERVDSETQQVKLGFCVERGIDFERVSFTPHQKTEES